MILKKLKQILDLVTNSKDNKRTYIIQIIVAVFAPVLAMFCYGKGSVIMSSIVIIFTLAYMAVVGDIYPVKKGTGLSELFDNRKNKSLLTMISVLPLKHRELTALFVNRTRQIWVTFITSTVVCMILEKFVSENIEIGNWLMFSGIISLNWLIWTIICFINNGAIKILSWLIYIILPIFLFVIMIISEIADIFMISSEEGLLLMVIPYIIFEIYTHLTVLNIRKDYAHNGQRVMEG